MRPLYSALFFSLLSSAPTLVSARKKKGGGADHHHHHNKKDTPVEYGVDVSFPIHRETASTNYAWLKHNMAPSSTPTPKEYQDMPIQPLGDRQKFYEDFMNGCVEYYGKKGKRCWSTEADRISMSLRQPQSMQNYTDIGYKKIKAPEKAYKLLRKFWDTNKDNVVVEKWPVGNTYTNNWAANISMLEVGNGKLRGGGQALKDAVWDAAREVLEEWTGQELTPTSLYGIRKYPTGSVLSPHVDRLPLVTSAIMCIDQDVEEPWVLEVYGHDGKATNVTMEPGDMVLYESHSVIHGRPFPLKGNFLANIFIHFEPVGHSKRHGAHAEDDDAQGNVHEKYKKAVKEVRGGHEANEDGLPLYIMEGSPEAAKWRRDHANTPSASNIESPSAHKAAQEGNVAKLKGLVEREGDHLVHAKDANGWTPLHEAARNGKLEVVEFLIKKGSKVNERTHEGSGGTPLWWVVEEHGEDHPVAELLRSVGAENIAPDEL